VGVLIDRSYEEIILHDRWRRIANRPALVILILYLIIVGFYFSVFGFFNSAFLFTLFLILPVIPAVLLEYRWELELLDKKSATSQLYETIRSYRLGFILAGFIISFLLIPFGFLLRILVLKGSMLDSELNFLEIHVPTNQANLFLLAILILVSAFTGLLAAASFYRVRAEEYDSGRRYNLVSAPSQVVSLASYSFIGVYFGLWILWAGQRLNPALSREDSFEQGRSYYERIPLDVISFWSIVPIFLVVTVFYLTLVISAKYIPYFIYSSRYKLPNTEIIKEWVKYLGILFFVILIVSYIGMDYSSSDPNLDLKMIIHYIFIIVSPILMYRIGNSYSMSGNLCQDCNILSEGGLCPACIEKHDIGIPIKIKFSPKISHPTCPSCGIIWDSISRKCDGCDFTIILSCEKCSQTLNPLWHSCNLCGEPRRTIPELALQAPGSPGYARNQAFLLIMASFLLPALILQITIIIGTYEIVRTRQFTNNHPLDYLYDDAARAILLLLTITCVGIIVGLSSIERKRPMMLVANKIATFPGTILITTTFSVAVYRSFINLFDLNLSGIIGRIFIFLLTALFFTYSIMNHYKSLIQFRPVVAFDPSLAIDKGVV
jgi:hypothetical protein